MRHLHNLLLATLPPAVADELAPKLRPVQFVQEHALYRAGERVTQVWFPESGLVSYLVPSGGARIEIAMVGHESVAGIAAALADPVAVNTAIVQMSGQGYALDAALLRNAADRHPDLRAALLRHHEAAFVQVQQAVVCNVVHTIDERLARWLMRAYDLTGRATLELTQEFLSDMLGVRRASVSAVAQSLQEAKFIAYRRGTIQILDRDGLRAAACECYGVVKRHYERLVKPHAPAG